MVAAGARDDTTDTSEWQRRRFASGALRVAVTLVPIATSVEVSLLLGRALPSTSSTATAIGRLLLIAICSLLALALTDAVARKFLPLATLLQLSLVFPDRTPSRFRTALKGGSGRRLAREVVRARRQGLSDDPSRAAEQLLILATAIGDHDRRTRGHSERVRLYTELIAEELHLSDDERWRLQWAALIHDIGKITVPTEILNKKGPPDAREWAILKRHPAAGAELAAPVEPWLGDAVHAVGGHHERWDGGGYPNGLSGEEIPRSAAIVAVADAFEVMTAIRSYKKALPLTEARAELTRCAGTHFDPDVVRALLNVSIGRLRSAMGVFAVIAHLPFLGQVARAASYAPTTVSTAAGMTTTGATAGVSVLALSGGLAIASTASASSELPRTVPSAFEEGDQAQMMSEPAIVVPATSAPSVPVAVAVSTSDGGAKPVKVAAPSPIATTAVPLPDEPIAPVDPTPAPAELVAFDSPTPVAVAPAVDPFPVAEPPAATVTPAIATSPKPSTNSGPGDSGKKASSSKSGKGTKEKAGDKHGGADKGESDNNGKKDDKKSKSGKNG